MTTFSERLLNWHSRHGRHDLPWQHPRSPYRVWVSEVMLQQTQVSTVIPYFERWMKSYPDVQSLAQASMDNVLGHWAGLGYYARGRNLHAAAIKVVAEHDGQLPQDMDALIALPGIGRSTAGAILAQAFNQAVPILDGNVKRVLSRHAAIDGWPGRRQVENRLWLIAEQYMPSTRAADYTQAIMDLGATLCTRRKPRCDACPLAADCGALAAGDVHRYPGKAEKKKRPLKYSRMLLATNEQGEVLLQRRPPAGIWGGLWCLPEIPEQADAGAYCRAVTGEEPAQMKALPMLRHGFTHFELEITPIAVTVRSGSASAVMESPESLWYNPSEAQAPGLPAPVSKLIGSL